MSFYVRSSTYILLHHASPTTSISPRCSPAVVSSPDCASDVCCAWGPCILKGEPPLEQHGQMGHGAWCWGDIWYFWLGQVAKSKWSPDGCASGLFMSVSPGKKGRPAEWRTPGPWRITDHFLTKHVNFTESSKSRFRPIAIWLKKNEGMLKWNDWPIHSFPCAPCFPLASGTVCWAALTTNLQTCSIFLFKWAQVMSAFQKFNTCSGTVCYHPGRRLGSTACLQWRASWQHGEICWCCQLAVSFSCKGVTPSNSIPV